MKRLSLIILTFLFFVTFAHSQDMAKAGAALSAASEAFESGDYNTALSSVATFEQAMGKATAYSHYLKIMSYYKLKDYENCKQQAAAYLKTAETDDDYAPEICKIYNELQGKTQTANISAAIVKATAQNSVVINGVRWAKFNVGEKGKFVFSSEKVGKYYALEEAKTSCPAGWRLPTKEEMQSLVKSGSVRTAINGTSGRKFGNGNNSIFLPRGEDGYYITDALSKHPLGIDDDEYSYVIVLHYGVDYVDISAITLSSKMSVRCVCEQ